MERVLLLQHDVVSGVNSGVVHCGHCAVNSYTAYCLATTYSSNCYLLTVVVPPLNQRQSITFIPLEKSKAGVFMFSPI